jgi:acyl-CoA synthetase (NDP forming)
MALVAERRRTRPQAPAALAPLVAAVHHVEALRRAGLRRLGWLELAPLLEIYGIRGAPAELAATPAAARAAAGRLGAPVVLKVVSPDVAHKTDVGGVRLGLATPADAERAAGELLARVRDARPDAAVRGVLVQRMAPAGRELLVGVVHDAQFGPLVVVGFGGIYVEVLKDTTARLAPLAPSEALTMLDELRMAPLLSGVRGEAAVARAALAETVSRFAQLAVDFPDLAEIELNPLIATPDGTIAVDARATLTPGGPYGHQEESRQA